MRKLFSLVIAFGSIITIQSFAQTNTFPSTGNVGIGTVNPVTPLHVLGGNGMSAGWSQTATLNANYPVLLFNSSSSKWAGIGYDHSNALAFWVNSSTSDVAANNKAMVISNSGNIGVGIDYPDNAQGWNKVLNLHGTSHAKIMVTETSGVKVGIYSHQGYNGKIGTESNHNLTLTAGYWNDVMTLTTQGNVGIGTLAPSEKLSVNGKIRAKEVKVETANWPDYVFEPNYQLPDLKITEQFIKENRHLPEIPSAKEVAVNGISLGEMNAKLLQKIEELTLHLIEQNKELNKLKASDLELKREIIQLKYRP